MQFREEYVERLRSCLESEEDWHHVERCFREGLGDDEVEDASPIVFAFGYMLVASRREELRERVGVFGAQFEIEGRIFPKPLAEIDEDTLDLLGEVRRCNPGASPCCEPLQRSAVGSQVRRAASGPRSGRL